jgi:hypothetical protein
VVEPSGIGERYTSLGRQVAFTVVPITAIQAIPGQTVELVVGVGQRLRTVGSGVADLLDVATHKVLVIQVEPVPGGDTLQPPTLLVVHPAGGPVIKCIDCTQPAAQGALGHAPIDIVLRPLDKAIEAYHPLRHNCPHQALTLSRKAVSCLLCHSQSHHAPSQFVPGWAGAKLNTEEPPPKSSRRTALALTIHTPMDPPSFISA